MIRFITENKNKVYPILLLIIGFLIRLWLVNKRWISPDEGWHLTDISFVLQGRVPIVDFISRQPLYVYLMALFIKIFGVSIFTGRVFLLLSSVVISLFIYLISKRIFNEKAALIALTIYTFLPLSISFSVLVREETLAILFTTIGMYFVAGFLNDNEKRIRLFFAGIFVALAFYVRATNLASFCAVFLFLLLYIKTVPFKTILKNYTAFFAGYFMVVFVFFLFYGLHQSFAQNIMTRINPFEIIFTKLGKILFAVKAQTPEVDQSGFRTLSQTLNVTMSNIRKAMLFNLFLVFSAVISLYFYIKEFVKNKRNAAFFKMSLLYLWFFFIAAFYGFHALERGFFVAYFRELTPPLIIICAGLIYSLVKKKNVELIIGTSLAVLLVLFSLYCVFDLTSPKDILQVPFLLVSFIAVLFFKDKSFNLKAIIISSIVIFYLVLVFFIEPMFGEVLYITKAIVLTEAIFIYAAFFFIWKKRQDFEMGMFMYYFIISLMVIGFAISATNAGYYIDRKFEALWSPKALDEVTKYIENNSTDDDQVMSGVLVWSFQSKRKPFPVFSHPAEFLLGMPDEVTEEITTGFSQGQPKIVVMDKYIEKNYIHDFTWISDTLKNHYSLKKTMQETKLPLQIYQLNQPK